ncbi:phosphopantetheine-binding protein [Kitasatospora sp. NPDC101801]|uniref:phosphopantetheine-binding protein n=1 Tax=Kitasatospora sp. NPDC101801 TaxID=3364103 RepID=UPI003822BCA7
MQTDWTPEFEHVLREYLPLLAPGQQLLPEAQLTALGLDSLSTVQLLIGLEDALAVTIPDAMLTPENFATPAALSAALGTLTDGRS